ncbi:L domain-like protein [Piromyces finnis]|uniref:L domain-like protein n=1 Tax=Piromyces finnis TaxID=1754191 RepID=A0A1Y1V1V9_9FUNG|nr:L domain-like protein [Piromyces finnis]|eukprot:ORX45340.1 L domain-like protein [Piromyces finnis]
MKDLSFILVAFSIFLFGNVLADDCSTLNSAISLFGDDLKKKFSGSNCCTYSGITCDGSGHVTEIKFDNVSTYFNDNVPEAFDKLSNLQYLTSLTLTNFRTHSLPPNIGNIKSLKTLILNENFYSCSIPDEFGKLTNLEHLEMKNNFLNGKIPDSFKNLVNLKYL